MVTALAKVGRGLGADAGTTLTTAILDPLRPRIVVHTWLGDYVADPLGGGVAVPGITGYDVVFGDTQLPSITQLGLLVIGGAVLAGYLLGK